MAAPESTARSAERIAIRTCPLCEAGCGLEITVRDETVVRIRGDMNDVFSKGYICPKGSTLKQLHVDPDRDIHRVPGEHLRGQVQWVRRHHRCRLDLGHRH